MPEWLQILMGVLGGFNIVGLVVWIVKTVGGLGQRAALLEAAIAGIKSSCLVCDGDKNELFRRLRRLELTTVAIAAKMGVHVPEED